MYELFQHPQTGLYSYRIVRRFDPGAQAEVFNTSNHTALLDLKGPGQYFREHLRVTQHPQVWFNRTITKVGQPRAAGQIFFQPLIDPSAQ